MVHSQELLDIPDLLSLHQYKPDDYPYLLASNTTGAVNTRYSILMAYPEQTIIQKHSDSDCLSSISTRLSNTESDIGLPFIGGWFVFLSYEYAGNIEPSVTFFSEQSDLPVAFISRIPAAIIVDHHRNRSTIVTTHQRKDLIKKITNDIKLSPSLALEKTSVVCIEEEHHEIYRNHLNKLHQYIKDGDIFQANLSRLWIAKYLTAPSPLTLFKNLQVTNPAPFAALVKFEEKYIISSSPERLISVQNGIAETRPIAGTHPRGKNLKEDEELSRILLKNPKERAEHVMLIDLERNDLGRICQPGSISVNDNMILETYAFVHHIVSSVSGKLKSNLTVQDVLHAVFPGGTITGCPKVRCMEIISELEQSFRGAYTGSIGYVSDNGNMDFNILIRTMTLHDNTVKVRAGAGIVYDSETEKELNETRHKVRGLLSALQPY